MAPARVGTGDGEVVVSIDGRRLRPVKSLTRAIRTLHMLADRPDGLSLTALATAIETSKTATYNIISTLELEGLVRRDEHHRYHLGWQLLEFGDAVRDSWTLGEPARASVVQLADLTGETALLSVLDGTTVFCVEMVESPRATPIDHGPGRRTDPNSDACGLVLLAHSRRFDDANGTDAPSSQRLRAVRAEGFAVVHGVGGGDLASIAAPVADYTRTTVAALALVGPERRLTPDRCAELTPIVVDAAQRISAALGARRVGVEAFRDDHR